MLNKITQWLNRKSHETFAQVEFLGRSSSATCIPYTLWSSKHSWLERTHGTTIEVWSRVIGIDRAMINIFSGWILNIKLIVHPNLLLSPIDNHPTLNTKWLIWTVRKVGLDLQPSFHLGSVGEIGLEPTLNPLILGVRA